MPSPYHFITLSLYNIILYLMKVTHYLPLAAACLMMVGCGAGKQKAEMTVGIQLANLDTTALPGSSFYQYACGGWIENHPLSPEYSQ